MLTVLRSTHNAQGRGVILDHSNMISLVGRVTLCCGTASIWLYGVECCCDMYAQTLIRCSSLHSKLKAVCHLIDARISWRDVVVSKILCIWNSGVWRAAFLLS